MIFIEFLTINNSKIHYLTYMMQLCNKYPANKPIFWEKASYSVILCYSRQMTKIKVKKLSLRFVPYLFIAVTILTAFGSNNGTWAWMISILAV